MGKALLLFTGILCFTFADAQTGFLVLKKHNKTVRIYWKDSNFTFETRDGYWITGYITRIEKDSFYFTQEIIQYYNIGTDTIHYNNLHFSVHDVVRLPSKKQLYSYANNNMTLGHEKFVWIRNGFIFQVAGAGYAGLNIINDLGRKEPPFAKSKLKGLGIDAAVFLIGTILHFRFDPYTKLGRKFRLVAVPVEVHGKK